MRLDVDNVDGMRVVLFPAPLVVRRAVRFGEQPAVARQRAVVELAAQVVQLGAQALEG